MLVFLNYLPPQKTLNKNHTQYVSSAAVKNLQRFPNTWYTETTILNVSNIIQLSLSSKQSQVRLFIDFFFVYCANFKLYHN